VTFAVSAKTEEEAMELAQERIDRIAQFVDIELNSGSAEMDCHDKKSVESFDAADTETDLEGVEKY